MLSGDPAHGARGLIDDVYLFRVGALGRWTVASTDGLQDGCPNAARTTSLLLTDLSVEALGMHTPSTNGNMEPCKDTLVRELCQRFWFTSPKVSILLFFSKFSKHENSTSKIFDSETRQICWFMFFDIQKCYVWRNQKH